MEFCGKVWKTEDRPPWVIEVPSLGVITQGYTKKEALAMLKDALEELIFSYFDTRGKIEVVYHGEGIVGVTCSERKLLLSLSLIKQREESGQSIREVASRLGSKSPNAYARYERGRVNMSIEKFDQLLQAVNPTLSGIVLSFG
jgi:predicted RNase H-like HicB family nuclease